MPISKWAWAAAAAALGVGGTALVVHEVSAQPASPAPPPSTPPSPIPITQGHRYEVTLTFGGPTTAAALLANVVPNIQVGLNAVAPNEYSFVHAIAPNNTQVVYVVDAIGGAAGSVHAESPQTFYADLNAASMGGIGVQVSDLGPSSSSPPIAAPAPPPASPPIGAPGPPPALPPPASPPASPPPASPPASPPPASPPASSPLTLASIVTDPALVTYAQAALEGELASGKMTSTGGAITPNGNPNDPATLAALQAMEAANPNLPKTGRLDFAHWGAAVLLGLIAGANVGPGQTITDPSVVTLAQASLATGIGYGQIPNVDYGAAQVNGDPNDPAWRAAVAAAMTPWHASSGAASVFPVDGTLNDPAFALLLTSAITPPLGAGGVVPVTPATPVTDASEVTLAQQAIRVLASMPAFAFFGSLPLPLNGNAADPQMLAVVAAYQANQTGLQHRTTPGVLDYLTLASLLGQQVTATSAANASPQTVVGPMVTRAPVIAGTQEAMLTALKGRLAFLGVSYAGPVDGNLSPAFVRALGPVVAGINQGTASQGYALSTGQLDYYIFAAIFVIAYMSA